MQFLCSTLLASVLAFPAFAGETVKNPMTESASWQDLQFDILGDGLVADGSQIFTVDAPYRAHDAATVPIVIEQTDPDAVIKSAMIVVDENPAPLAADITFGPSMAPLDMEVRVRVDQYSNIRVIADTADGMAMNGRFVKASGGCSAPASRDPEVALANMGQMQVRHFADENAPKMSVPRREAQIMIRHPNYSGLQRDQVTQLFITAHFIDFLEVYQGDEMLFTMAGGISISENPVFRFEYNDNGSTHLTVRATDTEGNVFQQKLPKNVAS